MDIKRLELERALISEDPTIPNAEENAKNAVLDDLQERRRKYLEDIRRHMRLLYLKRVELKGRKDAWVTADDARVYFESLPGIPESMSRNFLGVVFRGGKDAFGKPEWKTTGETSRSRTSGSHANRILRWKLCWPSEETATKDSASPKDQRALQRATWGLYRHG